MTIYEALNWIKEAKYTPCILHVDILFLTKISLKAR